jgi:hypothetical protein
MVLNGGRKDVFVPFFCKVSLLAILVARLFNLSIENINQFLFLLRKPFFEMKNKKAS